MGLFFLHLKIRSLESPVISDFKNASHLSELIFGKESEEMLILAHSRAIKKLTGPSGLHAIWSPTN